MIKLVALLGSFGLGVCFSLLGAISVKLMPRLGIDKGQFGTLISLFMGSCLVLSLVMGVAASPSRRVAVKFSPVLPLSVE